MNFPPLQLLQFNCQGQPVTDMFLLLMVIIIQRVSSRQQINTGILYDILDVAVYCMIYLMLLYALFHLISIVVCWDSSSESLLKCWLCHTSFRTGPRSYLASTHIPTWPPVLSLGFLPWKQLMPWVMEVCPILLSTFEKWRSEVDLWSKRNRFCFNPHCPNFRRRKSSYLSISSIK